MPPPLTPEQYFQVQMQMMATLNNTVQALQQVHAQPPPQPPPQQPRDRRAEFLRGHLPTFLHTSDTLQMDDWLHAVEHQLDVAQYDDRERVLYAAGQLRGAALDWWESHRIQDRGLSPGSSSLSGSAATTSPRA